MAGDKKLPVTVVIGAIDNVTYKVMSINEKLKKVTAPVGRVKAAFSSLGEESGLGKLTKSLGKIGETGKEFFGTVADTILKVGAASVAAAGAVYGLVHTFADAGDEIAVVSSRLGLTTKSFQELAFAANQVNIPQEQFVGGLTKLSKGIGEAAAGTGEALIGFNALGISVRDNQGKLRNLDDILPEVADKLGEIKNQNLRNAIAMKLFGREGAKLNELFNEGSEGLAKFRAEANRVGAVMTPEQIKSAQEFDNGMKSVMSTLLSVRNVIGAALAPVLVDLGRKLQDFILSHQKEIKAFASAFAEKLPAVLADIAGKLQVIGTVLAPVITLIGYLSDKFGGLNLIITGLLAWFGGPLLSSFLAFAGALSGAVIPAMQVGVTVFGLLFGAVQTLAAGLAALVGWPVLIGAALVGAVTLAYKHWKPFADFIDGIYNKVSGFFGGSQIGSTTASAGASASQASFAPQANFGFGKTVDASLRSQPPIKTESVVQVNFENMPKGTRVEQVRSETPLNLSMGYVMGGM